MPAARIIPCLDVADGRVVKGVRFRDHRDVGGILDHVLRYRDEGADELVFYDITASADRRSVDLGWVRQVSAAIDIPFSVAGGIGDVEGAARCLAAGADKVSVNSPALERPELIAELASAFGRQCVVLGIDSLRGENGALTVKQYTGRPEATRDSGRSTIEWAREAVALGAGEIVLNCIYRDGVRRGYDLDQLRALVAAVEVPVIISGGAGRADDFAEAFDAGASGALAASVFHDRRIAIPALKDYLSIRGIEGEAMIDVDAIDWAKMDGLVPAIVQHAATGEVRMLGYMDRAALEATIADRLVTFHSRSRGGPWRKGETSGNLLDLVDIRVDRDRDALLVRASPRGPTCHTGSSSCFGDHRAPNFLATLAAVVEERAGAAPEASYTARLIAGGTKRIAQKVGEEGVEVALAAVAGDAAEVTSETADLVHHLSVLLRQCGSSWEAVSAELQRRHASSTETASS